ncbi:MAG: UDP-glucose 4-epimerase, partial [uncultured Frankineae bacterium]
ARHGRQPLPRQPAGRDPRLGPHDRAGHRGGHRRAPPRAAPAARPHRVRAGRHPQPAHREGHRLRRRRHGRAPERHRHPARRRGPHGDEGDQRHRDDAAARRVPEGAEHAHAGGQVDDRRLRVEPARSGAVHRGARAALAAQGRLRQGRGRGRGVRAGLRPPAAGRDAHPAALHQLHRGLDRDPADALPHAAGGADGPGLRPPHPAVPRGRRSRGPAPVGQRRPPGDLQRRRTGGAAPVAGAAAARPSGNAGAVAGRVPGGARLPRCRCRRLLARADALPRARSRRGRDATAGGVRVGSASHRGGLRRLRRGGAAAADRSRAGLRGGAEDPRRPDARSRRLPVLPWSPRCL